MGKTIESRVDVERGYEVVTTYRLLVTSLTDEDPVDERFLAIGIQYEWEAQQMAQIYKDSRVRKVVVVSHTEIRYVLRESWEQ